MNEIAEREYDSTSVHTQLDNIMGDHTGGVFECFTWKFQFGMDEFCIFKLGLGNYTYSEQTITCELYEEKDVEESHEIYSKYHEEYELHEEELELLAKRYKIEKSDVKRLLEYFLKDTLYQTSW